MIMVQWKMAKYLNGNDSIEDTPIFLSTMMIGGRVDSICTQGMEGVTHVKMQNHDIKESCRQS